MRQPIRKRQKKGRVSKRLPKKPLFLIVCEGEITEKDYFNCLRIKKKISSLRIRIVTGGKDCRGTDPKTLVECAKRKRVEFLKQEGLDYDQTWCVFDCDDHKTLDQAIDQANANGINHALSNPCFEIWCLLHFRMQTGYIERGKLQKLIADHCMPNYKCSGIAHEN
jgi:hypothetical protein